MLCSYGCNQEAIIQLKNKKWCCSDSVNKCPEMKKKNSETTKAASIGKLPWYQIQGVDHPLKGTKSWNSGLTVENNQSIKNGVKNYEKYYQNHKRSMKDKHHSLETREKMRLKRLEFYKNGGWVRCGRAKKIRYQSSIAGDILVDGNWELVVAKYFDSKQFHWKRNTLRFSYINLKGKEATYCPDFWVDELNSFVEVKGYKTELDDCKWKQFNQPLIVWNYSKLLEMKLINKSGNILL